MNVSVAALIQMNMLVAVFLKFSKLIRKKEVVATGFLYSSNTKPHTICIILYVLCR